MTEEELQTLIDASLADRAEYLDIGAPTGSSNWGIVPGSGTRSISDVAQVQTSNRLYYQFFVPSVTRSYVGWEIDVTNTGTACQQGIVEADGTTVGWPFLNPGIITQSAVTVSSVGNVETTVSEFELQKGHLYAFFTVSVSCSFDRTHYNMLRNATPWFFLTGTAINTFHQRYVDSVTPATFTEPMTAGASNLVSTVGQNTIFILTPA